jgi:outer membrane immunogenic protein
MFNPNDSVTLGLGIKMNKFFLRLAFAVAVLLPMPSALAADLDVPPPMDDLRPANFDWSGPYIGVFGAAVAVDGTYDATCTNAVPCAVLTYTDIEHSGIGYAGGILGGWNYQMDTFVFGVEGDWAFGGTVATNDEPGIDTDISFNNIATLRARAGFALDNTLLYVTGGLAAVDMEFGAVMSTTESDSKWVYGWTVGGGLEHAFSDHFSGRIEYLYVGLDDADFSMTDAAASTFDATQSFDDIHMVRVGLTYNFW